MDKQSLPITSPDSATLESPAAGPRATPLLSLSAEKAPPAALHSFIGESQTNLPPASVADFAPLPRMGKGAVSRQGDKWKVLVDGRERQARLAASCLLEPASGDDALWFGEGENFYILSVLERKDPAALGHIALPARAAVKTRDLRLFSEKISAISAETEIQAGRFSLAGALGAFRFSILTFRARQLTEKVRHFLSRALTRRVDTEETADIRAKRLRQRAQEEISLEAQRITAEAEGPVKVDGATIQLG
ncbi:MAG: DUF3540 domain-containing protein [Deltaproteobacteria bacterium]|jgi:hypothetical protein|nr:DUF3540 domain-containing protein [Deltaproteobacteria bacterium]